jgi:hypothetical protein
VLVTMTSPRITVKATPGITPQQARDTRALALRFILDCYAEKKAAHPGGQDDAERRSNEIRAKDIIPR